ncbi:MAG TPA: helix-turn-helix transcriptional regulator [Myxococcales bacterium]|nr:helix-turn-helix transcriptional regulator [Myxococcales bacterium]
MVQGQGSVVKDVGRRIRQLRVSRSVRMTQEDLSERARISVSFLSMIERGERSPHLETLAAIAHGLDVRIADLFLDEGESSDVEPIFRPLLEACRKHNLGKRDVDRLISVVRTMFAA